MICFYCKEEKEDTRPYGPGGAETCYTCGMLPENIKTTEGTFMASVMTSLDLLKQGGILLINAETGEVEAMTPERLAEYGGLPDA